MTKHANLIEALANSQTYHDYARAFNETTGMPVTLRSLENWQLPFHGQPRENSFCALIASKSRSCAGCLQMQEKLCAEAMNQPATITCTYGLFEAAVPVRLGAVTVGFLQTGQVLGQRPTAKKFEKVGRQLDEHELTCDRDQTRRAYFATQVISKKRMDSIKHLLSVFAEHLAMKGNQIILQQAHAEPPVITKAKQFIDEHYAEELSLGQVAAAVHTSSFYFCKLFKRATGFNYTEYVSRIRIEKAKNLLLNPHLRVSEIAYEIGFQSLTHFNRVFKKIAGQSPSEYRSRLPARA